MKLILDTSSEESFVALIRGDDVLASCIRAHANQLSRTLMADLLAVLEEGKVSLEEISSIGVGIGPGSYTGTRVGVAVAQGLSYARQIPLFRFCSLLAFAPDQEGVFACVMPSRTGEFFLLKGEIQEKKTEIEHSLLLTLPTLLQELEGVPVCIGKPFEEMRAKVPSMRWQPPKIALRALITSVPHLSHATDLIYLHTP